MNMRKDEAKTVKSLDLSVLNETHANKWVALSADYKRILSIGERLIDVLKIKESDKVVFKVLPNLGYAPFIVA